MTEKREEIQAAKVYKLEQVEQPKEEIKQEIIEEPKVEVVEKIVVKKDKNIVARLLFITLLLLSAYTVYLKLSTDKTFSIVRNYYSPISTLNEEKELDIESTIVQDLYNKVKTNIREDLLNSSVDNEMRLYLAFRNIPHDKFYESNCDGFNNGSMAPYTCNNNEQTFKPNAFKKEYLKIEYEKLFGENDNFVYDNIQLGNNCMGGYQYIEERGEYVEGSCTSIFGTSYKVNKTLISATSYNSKIILKETVKYTTTEGKKLPESLVSGTYVYEFRLDNNYNYIYVNKYLEEEK